VKCKEATTTRTGCGTLGGADTAIRQKDKENSQVIVEQFRRLRAKPALVDTIFLDTVADCDRN
jgi:hypothetical protein